MLSIRSSYNRNYGTDEMYSSSPSPSFENKSSLFNYYNHYKESQADTIMDEQHHQQHTDLTFHGSDWPINKSPQSSYIHHRDDLYSPVDGAAVATSYSSYENYENFSDDMTNNIHMDDSDYHNMSWTSTTDDNSMANMMTIAPNKPDNYSPPNSFAQQNKKHHPQFSSTGNHLLNMFPAPAPPPYHGNMFYQRPNYTSSSYPCINKGDKYHTRFKSANARLSPFTEQQETYQQLLTTTSSSPPHLVSEEKLAVVKNEAHDITDPHYFYHNYQTKKEYNHVPTDQKSFQFDAVLFASTAVRKKHDELPVTYLNRGQAYLVDLNASSHQQQCYPASTITSTLSIAFHEPSHRQLAESYWKYWISQQETPKDARAIDLDINQTTGIYNVRLVSFDRVSFDWHSRFGAKVYIRFNCLSTDFSRIKGVKGIPLRFVMETNLNFNSLPDDSALYKGTFEKNESDELSAFQYKELCYCKVKLFRDKGAERKNKDDKKQMAKQMEKVIASTNGNPQQHPLWPIISQSHKSTSLLSLLPSSPDISLDDFDESSETANLLQIMVASSNENQQQPKRKRDNKSVKKALLSLPMEIVETKKSRNSSKSFHKLPTALCFYVWTRHIHSTPHEVYLHQLTTHELKIRLSAILSIHSAKISEILWKRKKSEENASSDVLVLVEDTFIAEHIADGEMMTVDLEIKADGNFRLVLEF